MDSWIGGLLKWVADITFILVLDPKRQGTGHLTRIFFEPCNRATLPAGSRTEAIGSFSSRRDGPTLAQPLKVGSQMSKSPGSPEGTADNLRGQTPLIENESAVPSGLRHSSNRNPNLERLG